MSLEKARNTTSLNHPELKALWQWTLTPEAVAPCFAKDVIEMRENGSKDSEFYWLGRVPCRTVKLVGLLVGAQPYEHRIVYYLDDGTAVIECQHRPLAPKKDDNKSASLPVLKPVAYVGDSVVVTGRIAPLHDSRKIVVDSIRKCSSSNEEPKHWIDVRRLHKSDYSREEPFVIPERPVKPPVPPPTMPALLSLVRPETPSASSSIPISPLKSQTKSPHKLRHPSRLHTRDLTDNAFRIYLKHYMANAESYRPPTPDPETPTKASRAAPRTDATPRPRRFTAGDLLRPRTPPPEPYGFTISYLRRVPELALMAQRVVKAEAKRRARAARKAGVETDTAAMGRDKEKLRPRMKRLFAWAVLQLVKDGDAVSWDGPRRPCPSVAGADPLPSGNALWRYESSAGGDSTMFSVASTTVNTSLDDEEDDGELTDPGEGEEAFVPLTPAFLANAVERAVGTLTARAREQARDRRDAPSGTGGAGGGPMPQEVTQYLKRSDDVWRNLSEFAVTEALEYLKEETRAWMVGGGRWELTV